jgi:hypothetical protein
MKKMTVTDSEGVSLQVWVGEIEDFPPRQVYYSFPNDVVLSINKGENFHGSLEEAFAVGGDSGFSPTSVTLWMSMHSDQTDDNFQRFYLTGVCYFDEQPEEVDFSTDDCIDGVLIRALLYSFLKYLRESYEAYDPNDPNFEYSCQPYVEPYVAAGIRGTVPPPWNEE